MEVLDFHQWCVRERELEKIRKSFCFNWLWRWVFLSFNFVPLKQKSCVSHVQLISVWFNSETNVGVQSVISMIVYGRTEHRPGQPNPTDPKGIGRVEWMLGSGSGPIFGSALVQVGFGSNPTQPIFF